MTKKCVICGEKIGEGYGKLNGSLIKVRDENKKKHLIYVCSECQKQKDWRDNAMIRGA